ncbi:MAG TPA: LysR family transcriptional regulator [Pseudomonadales bacterium]|nr:LysR family transcriptional regulator [Pseudomonadales bacterium]
MDTSQLKSFITVAELGSFSSAADKLHLTQPAISKRVSALEAWLDCRLFNRIGRRISLTREGETLLPRAREILLAVEQTEQALRVGSDSIAGHLNIMTSHHVGLHRLPDSLKHFINHYPEVNLDVQFVDSEFAHQAVLQGDIELAVVTLAPAPDPNIVATPIWHDPMAFVAPPDHPLLKQRHIDLQMLSQHRAVLPGLSTYTGRLVADLFRRHHLRLDARNTSTNYLETIKMMVSIGMGWSVLPLSMVDTHIVTLDVTEHVPARQLGVIRHKRRQLSNAAWAFIDNLLAKNDKMA